MTTCQDVQPQLSLFVDGQLGPEARRAVATHLEGCEACRGLVRDLERLRATARALGPIMPPDHVWLEVAGQIRLDQPKGLVGAPGGSARSAARQWLGLAAALVIVTIGAYIFLRPPSPAGTGGVSTDGNAPAQAAVQAIADDLMLATQHYERAIAELDALSKSSNGAIDPAIAEMLRQNIAATDRAIAESQGAVRESPDNAPARDSLIEALRRKVDVLQATVMLMNDMRRGDQAGAAESAALAGKKG